MVAVTETVDILILERSLVTPHLRVKQLRQKYPEEDQYRRELIKYFLKTSVYASWEELGRELLLYNQTEALAKVKKRIKAHKGITVYT